MDKANSTHRVRSGEKACMVHRVLFYQTHLVHSLLQMLWIIFASVEGSGPSWHREGGKGKKLTHVCGTGTHPRPPCLMRVRCCLLSLHACIVRPCRSLWSLPPPGGIWNKEPAQGGGQATLQGQFGFLSLIHTLILLWNPGNYTILIEIGERQPRTD